MKALIRGAYVDHAINLWTRHATPRAVCHLILGPVSGRGFLDAVDPAAAGLFIFGHSTLGDWSSIPALYKSTAGGPLHEYAGVTPDDGGTPLSAEDFAAQSTVELLVLGHVKRYANGSTQRPRRKFLALEITSGEFMAAIDPNFIVWQTGEDWGAVSDDYKNKSGGPLIDTDDVQDVLTI